MTIVEEKYTAAQVAVDANLAEGKDWQKSNVDRRIRRIGFTGSAADQDTRIDVYYGSEKVMELRNQAIGLMRPRVSTFWHTSKLTLPAGVPMNLTVVTAASSNAVYLFIDFAELR